MTDPNFAEPINPQETDANPLDPSSERADSSERVEELPAVVSPRNLAIRSGQRVAHYQIEERVGAGAMATVYKARDPIAQRDVALKVLLPGADATTQERFRREARTVDRLDHPHIVHTYQVGQSPDDGTNFIAMELVTGSSLADVLERRGRLTGSDACALLEPVARALAYAHQVGIVHRDVKPSNILLRLARKGTPGAVQVSFEDVPVVPLLTDFGIARAYDAPELTNAGRTIGTPAFMAPEQCAGSAEIDGRADVYALGAVLYRCLVGRVPFAGTTTQILHAHVYDPLVIPDDALRDLPSVTVDILHRAMAKAPEDRYVTADLMADDLRLAAGSEGSMHAVLEGTATLTMDTAIVPRPNVMPMLSPIAAPVGRFKPPPSVADRVADQRRKARQGWVVLGAGAVLLLSVLVVATARAILPVLGLLAPEVTPVAELASGAPQVVENDDTVARPTMPDGASTESDSESATIGEAAPTPTVARTLEASLDYAWDNAQAFFEEEDWTEALTWLVAVQRIDPAFRRDLVRAMLVTTYVALAGNATQAGENAEAADHLAKAVELRPWDRNLAALEAAAKMYNEAGAAGKEAAGSRLQSAYAEHAVALDEAGRACQAAVQAKAALTVAPNAELLQRQADYDFGCEQAKAAARVKAFPGRILYSAVENGQYRIFITPLGPDATSSLIIEEGSQPQMNHSGDMVAFHSLLADMQGITGFRVNGGLSPSDRSVKFSDFVEDARDSPPSWSPQGDRLVFASMNYGDGRSRIHVTTADGERTVATLGYGKDPAWHPSDDLIVFNGTDETGNNPGLWLMRSDGSGRTRLTDNGNDQRPAWSPDGQAVVFMSNGRDGNWEVYRADLTSQSITRLTDHAAQDGLPSVSPDGDLVAFVSDRDGYWRLWFVPMEGGEAQPLANIAGELPKWLEHSIQWVN